MLSISSQLLAKPMKCVGLILIKEGFKIVSRTRTSVQKCSDLMGVKYMKFTCCQNVDALCLCAELVFCLPEFIQEA